MKAEVIKNPAGIYVRILTGECNQMDVLLAEPGTSQALNAEANAPALLRAGAKYYREQATRNIVLAELREQAADVLDSLQSAPEPGLNPEPLTPG